MSQNILKKENAQKQNNKKTQLNYNKNTMQLKTINT